MTDNLLTKGIITMNFLEERIMKDGVVKEAVSYTHLDVYKRQV